MKKILSALLAALMASSALLMSACSNSGQDEKETTPQATSNPTADAQEEVNEEELTDLELRQRIPDDLPEEKYGGEEFRVVTNDGDQYEEEIWVEEANGEACNDAVYNRNIRIEDRFDVKIFCERNSSPAGLPKTMSQAGTMDYHIVGLYDYQSYTPINAQALLNWYDTPHVNTEKPWHNKLANDDATVNHILYKAVDMIASDEGMAYLGIEDGDNSLLYANLQKICDKVSGLLDTMKQYIDRDTFVALADQADISAVFTSSHGFNAGMIYDMDFSSVENALDCGIRVACDLLAEDDPDSIFYDFHMRVENLETLDAIAAAAVDMVLGKVMNAVDLEGCWAR